MDIKKKKITQSYVDHSPIKVRRLAIVISSLCQTPQSGLLMQLSVHDLKNPIIRNSGVVVGHIK